MGLVLMLNVPAKAYDSAGWLDLKAAKASGAVAAGLYVLYNLTRTVAQQAADLDFGLWSFNESYSSNPNLGADQGIIDAKRWCNKADLVKQPEGAGTWMPNDQMGETTAIIEYFHAGAETILEYGRTPAFYGQTSVWDQIKGYGFKYFCHAPDGTEPPYPEAHMVQSRWPASTYAAQIGIEGVSCDVDTILTVDFGGWNANGLWPAPDPKPRKVPTMFLFQNPAGKEQFLSDGAVYPVIEPTQWQRFLKAGVPEIPVTPTFFALLMLKKV
jgi:hypothetical protein